MDPVSIIALVISAAMAIFALVTLIVNLSGATRNHDGAVSSRAYHEGEVDATLRQIEKNTSQTSDDVKQLDMKLDEYNGRLVRAEQRLDHHDEELSDIYDLLSNDVDPQRVRKEKP